jgi:glyoxalase superfamily protein
MGFGKTVPILRMFDEAKARLYIQVSKDGCVIKLSEHYGDASPGAAVRIETTELDAFQEQLSGKKYKYARPGVPQETPWGTKEMGIKDPFGNKLIFSNRA